MNNTHVLVELKDIKDIKDIREILQQEIPFLDQATAILKLVAKSKQPNLSPREIAVKAEAYIIDTFNKDATGGLSEVYEIGVPAYQQAIKDILL